MSGKYFTLNGHVIQKEMFQISSLNSRLKKLEKVEQNKSKGSRWMEIIETKPEINIIHTEKTRGKETKSWFFKE